MLAEGDKLPENISLQYMDGKKVKNIRSGELFSGKKIVMFAVPGAFTPACSELHLPGYVTYSYEIKKKGVDQIICISVNDAFVMDAWAKANNIVDEVKMIADGNGDFARAIGMNMDMSKFGLGERSMRYSMIVDNGKVTMLNLEKGGALDVSKAELILDAL
jgi:peroxiredoxin